MPDSFPVRPTADLLPAPERLPVVGRPLHSFDEFTKLRSVVVGTPFGANHPTIEESFENFFRVPDVAFVDWWPFGGISGEREHLGFAPISLSSPSKCQMTRSKFNF